ncbi:MAG: hypothetical protein HQ579_01025 [Candidatus Omnitrophica bacterium]|nr:hypothetical protein [Candidatus Omnitrophota bacterium]
MIKRIAIIMTVAFVFATLTGVVFAADQIRDQKKDQLRDGSCQDYTIENDAMLILADNKDKTRDRKKDGSCQNYTTKNDAMLILADNKDKTRDRKKDGSCQT